MSSQPSPMPFSLRKLLADVGHLRDLTVEAQEQLAAILAAVDDSPLRSSLTIEPDALLRECLRTEGDPLAQWEHELTVDAGLRQHVRDLLPERLVEIQAEALARLLRNQRRGPDA